MYDNRPLETLAAFAISFAAGLLSAVALAGYAKFTRERNDGGSAAKSTV